MTDFQEMIKELLVNMPFPKMPQIWAKWRTVNKEQWYPLWRF